MSGTGSICAGPQVETMLKSAIPDRERLTAIRRVKTWTAERFSLSDDMTVSVMEVACGLPGCPPLETIVTFWTTSDSRHAFKVFKPIIEVTPQDLPPSWMKQAIVSNGDDLSCC